MYDIVALGEMLIDFTCVGQDDDGYPLMQGHPGGAPVNFLAAAAKYGAKTAQFAKVGADAFGKLLIRSFADAGIGTEGIRISDEFFTTLAFVTLDEHGDREFSFARKPGADTQLRADELDAEMLENTRIFHFGTLSLTDEPARTATQQAVFAAKRAGACITFDPNYRAPLWKSPEQAKEQILWGLRQADVVKISDSEADFLFGLSPEQGAEKLLSDFGVKLALVTCGADGCVYRNARCAGRVPSLPGVKAVDTTGAGDIFGGSAVWKLLETGKAPEMLENEQLRQIVRFACAAAGMSVEKPGGMSSVPEKTDVLECLKRWEI